MVNWTDPIIQWNQLPGTDIRRLLDTWGKDEAFIAKYDISMATPFHRSKRLQSL